MKTYTITEEELLAMKAKHIDCEVDYIWNKCIDNILAKLKGAE